MSRGGRKARRRRGKLWVICGPANALAIYFQPIAGGIPVQRPCDCGLDDGLLLNVTSICDGPIAFMVQCPICGAHTSTTISHKEPSHV